MSVVYFFFDWLQVTVASVICTAVSFMLGYLVYHSYPKLKKRFNIVLFTSNVVITLYLLTTIAVFSSVLVNAVFNLQKGDHKSSIESIEDYIATASSLSCYWTAQSSTILLFMLRFN